LILSGYFASTDNYAPYLIPFEYISGFKYGYQVLMQFEFTDIQPLNCMNNQISPCDPLKLNYTFKEDVWLSCICLALLIMFLKTVAFIIITIKAKIKV